MACVNKSGCQNSLQILSTLVNSCQYESAASCKASMIKTLVRRLRLLPTEGTKVPTVLAWPAFRSGCMIQLLNDRAEHGSMRLNMAQRCSNAECATASMFLTGLVCGSDTAIAPQDRTENWRREPPCLAIEPKGAGE